MGVTIVSNELSEEVLKEIQEEADTLVKENNYSAHAIMHHLGLFRKLSISLYEEEGKLTMCCRTMCK